MDEIAKKIIAVRGKFVTCPIKMKLVTALLKDCLAVLFPHWHVHHDPTHLNVLSDLNDINKQLTELIVPLLTSDQNRVDATVIVNKFLNELPKVLETLELDARAILAGDPAANSLDEVIITYPGFYAIAIHRLAHLLYTEKVPLIPRIWSEFGHSKTGIDIHPGATIGAGFCIDHGTGVVIGETTIIGENVKLYHGVTLGGLSVSKKLAGKKRHPTLENNVIVYAGSTILGGETVIGHDSIIGGNVWLTNSVPPHSKIFGLSKG